VPPRLPVIVNPAAGGGRLMRHRLALDAAARGAGVTLDWLPTESPGHGEELAAAAAAAGLPLVLAFGGDGTYNEVARGLVGTPTSLGVLPGGTTSVLAYELGVRRPADHALEPLLAGGDREMRIGCTDRGDIFLQMLSAGPDTVVLERVPPGLKRVGGRSGIGLQAARELLGGPPMPRMRASWDGHHAEVGWAIVGNGRCYAGRWYATPGANPFVAGFEAVLQTRTGRRPAAGFFLALPFGRHLRRRDVVRVATPRIRLDALDAGSRYQVDGELRGRLPVEAWSDPRVLRIRVPA
jgi:diacylglycerol kinase family enzyme